MFLLEGAYFVSFCSLYAYTVTILLDYGYTEVQCGYITMLQYLVMMIAGPIYGRLIDRSISPKWLFIILVAGGMIVTPQLPFCFGSGFLWTMLSFSLISALDYCASSVFDTWTNQMTLRDSTIDYGNIRSAGSIFYATTALISGYLIAPLGINFLFWLHMGALGLSILLALPLSDPNKLPLLHPESDPETSADLQKESLWASFRKLLGCRPYVIFLICGTLYYFATRSVNGFMQVIINYIGGDASTYGLSVFLYCVGEFLLMRLASRLLQKGLPLPVLFIVSLAALGARILLLGCCAVWPGSWPRRFSCPSALPAFSALISIMSPHCSRGSMPGGLSSSAWRLRRASAVSWATWSAAICWPMSACQCIASSAAVPCCWHWSFSLWVSPLQ